MVTNKQVDEIVIRVSADISKLRADLMGAVDGLKVAQRETNNLSRSMEGFDKVTKAISFQTMTQGLLNVSTASAQLYTSLSNLDRVQYQVRASSTAVERAEDQVARKRLQLAAATEKYGSDSEKARMITDELATAQEQLANKQERLKLAQDQVNDTYILFASNIANTVFGSLQTMNTLLSSQQKLWIYNNVLTWNGIRATIAHRNALKLTNTELSIQKGLISLDSGGKIANAGATTLAATATKGFSMAINGLKAALGPVGIALIGITVAMEAYNNNWLGFKDSLDGLGKSLGLFKDETKLATDEISQFGDETDTTSGLIEKNMNRSLKDATKELYFYRLELKAVNEEQAKFNHGAATLRSDVGVRRLDQGGSSQGNFLQGLSAFFNPFPSAYADTSYVNVTSKEAPAQLSKFEVPSRLKSRWQKLNIETVYIEDVVDVLKRYGSLSGIKNVSDWENLSPALKEQEFEYFLNLMDVEDPTRILKDRILAKTETKLPPEIARSIEFERRLEKISEYDFMRRSMMMKGIMADKLIYQAGISGMPKQMQQRMAISTLASFARPVIGPPRSDLSIWTQAREMGLKNILINGMALSRFEQGKITKALAYSKGERGVNPMEIAGIDPSKKSTFDQLFQYIVFKAQSKSSADVNYINMIGGVRVRPDGNVVIKNKTLETLDKVSQSQRRTELFLEFGVDIGPVADSLSYEGAVMTASFERRLKELAVSESTYSSQGLLRSFMTPIGGQGPGLLLSGAGQMRTGYSATAAKLINSMYAGTQYSQQNMNKVAQELGLSATRYTGLMRDAVGALNDPGSNYWKMNIAQAQRSTSAMKAAQAYYKDVVYGGKVSTPGWILAEIKARDAYANSAEGQTSAFAYSVLTGGSFRGFTGNKRPTITGEDVQYIQMAGALGLSMPQSTLTEKISGQEYASAAREYVGSLTKSVPFLPNIFSGLQGYMGNIDYIMSQNPQWSQRGNPRNPQIGQAFYSSLRSQYTSKVNQIITRFNAGNYGEFDATMAAALLGGYFGHPELSQEYKTFDTQIRPILNISHGEFTDSLIDPQRGYDEIDDRIRYTTRLAQISTGATVI